MIREMRAAALLLLAAGCAPRAAPLAPPGRQEDVVFTRVSPLSRTREIARRTLTPLVFRRGDEVLQAKGQAFREQPVDLAHEQFSLYIPAGPPPPRGYGLLVFIAPWPDLTRPRFWRPALDRHGLIFVSAARSGNDESVLDRRVPLALLAYENVRATFRLDPARVYVGGLSGGSRVAEMVALAWPDVFHGALLNAGSDPIGGEQGIHLPPAELFRQFQATRVVFVTGEADEGNLRVDQSTRDSLRDFCVLNLQSRIARGLGHEPLDPASMERALAALDQPGTPDPADEARCNERLQRGLATKVAEVEAALARGDRAEARKLLWAIDGRYAGLAAAQILELDGKIGPP